MLPKTHILVGFIVSFILWLAYPEITWFYALIIFLASFLIDFDHYLYYLYKEKDHNLSRAYYWFIEKNRKFMQLSPEDKKGYKRTIMIFHGIECWITIALLIFVHKIFLFVLLGIIVHITLDFIDLYKTQQPIYIKTSQIYVHFKNKDKQLF